MSKEPKILIVGAGPCGLGAAVRLSELGYSNWLLVDAFSGPGGLAATWEDAEGFKWDVGGHVIFSHYKYFDDVLDDALGTEWNHHQRESWVWMRKRFIPYPLQNNIHRLPKEELETCLHGLVDVSNKSFEGPPRDFKEWLIRKFGQGLYDSFMRPYNFKVWAVDPSGMNVEWMGERVAPVDLKRIISNVVHNKDDIGWGPNATFRYPKFGGTGAIWKAVGSRIDPSRCRYGTQMVEVDAEAKKAKFSDGTEESYDFLISTVSLDLFLGMCRNIPLPSNLSYSQEEQENVRKGVRFATTHVIGIGMKGQPPPHLKTKAWMYFPEDDVPFYRSTVLSNYSSDMVPSSGGPFWSLMFEVSQSEDKPLDASRVVEDVSQGYPVPFYGRDQLCKSTFQVLEAAGIRSRGRFGAWKYEVANQDHSFMQGVEAADACLGRNSPFAAEKTFHSPGFVNARENRSEVSFSGYNNKR
uniref:Amine oxidase domain-containing protein n=1 Tax=Chromera velia CCMP2878 TaxID=1169474 RepID=A0A0G4HMB6_9ALVE|eukprot:Cvel_7452.t1-p1 / transcript=Cvel_7452.t1 / gene=Cvel_7452 / organism=Chromera_velia_CCMP2878 / gene_product=hypothetical protein / transcript_product=hypothetical protein / location=Cvel_scaffold390:2569-9373(-) / protein_length=466 / sequence_SO=supercontig / SO=protein_coding / is_pseudo=false